MKKIKKMKISIPSVMSPRGKMKSSQSIELEKTFKIGEELVTKQFIGSLHIEVDNYRLSFKNKLKNMYLSSTGKIGRCGTNENVNENENETATIRGERWWCMVDTLISLGTQHENIEVRSNEIN